MRFVLLDENDKVVGIRNGPSIVEGEIQHDTAQEGQIKNDEGVFITPETAYLEPQETLEDKIARIEKKIDQEGLINMEVMATIYEAILTGGN